MKYWVKTQSKINSLNELKSCYTYTLSHAQIGENTSTRSAGNKMKYSETEAINETQSIANPKTRCSNLNKTVYKNNKISLYLLFLRLL